MKEQTNPHEEPEELEHEHEHTPSAIATRLASGPEQSYLGDAVLGAMDGTVTTFAIVSAVSGAGLGPGAAAALGLANLLADGFSMAVGNYFRAKADGEVVDRVRRIEEEHVRKVPEGEREEVRQIFAQKGFEGKTLDSIVETITGDRKRWVDTMITEEWGLSLDTPDPVKAGAWTFAAFCGAGLLPLVPIFLLFASDGTRAFAASAAVTAATFFAVGWFKGRVLRTAPLRGGIETLVLGGGAAIIAYAVGHLTRSWVG